MSWTTSLGYRRYGERDSLSWRQLSNGRSSFLAILHHGFGWRLVEEDWAQVREGFVEKIPEVGWYIWLDVTICCGFCPMFCACHRVTASVHDRFCPSMLQFMVSSCLSSNVILIPLGSNARMQPEGIGFMRPWFIQTNVAGSPCYDGLWVAITTHCAPSLSSLLWLRPVQLPFTSTSKLFWPLSSNLHMGSDFKLLHWLETSIGPLCLIRRYTNFRQGIVSSIKWPQRPRDIGALIFVPSSSII